MSQADIVSIEPATGKELWRGKPGNVAAAVDRARRADEGVIARVMRVIRSVERPDAAEVAEVHPHEEGLADDVLVGHEAPEA